MAAKGEGFFDTSVFFSYLKKNKRLLLLVLGALVGVTLIFIGSSSASGSDIEGDSTEERLEAICSALSGVGECRVMVTYKEREARYGASAERVVESVAVVCKGADRAGVRAELTEMLSSLFGIGTNRIHISKMR